MLAKKLRRLLEVYAPALAGVITLAACLCFRNSLTHIFVADKLSLSQLYSGVFGWASVQTGALLSIYGMIFTKTDGFIGGLRSLPIMESFYRFVGSSIRLGLVLTVVTIPLLVFNRDMSDLNHPRYFIVAVWFGVFAWAFMSFVRVVRIFSALVRVKDRQEITG